MLFLLIDKYIRGENVDLFDGFITILKGYLKMVFYFYLFLSMVLILHVIGIISM